jgi:hypothetical protein
MRYHMHPATEIAKQIVKQMPLLVQLYANIRKQV